MTEVSVGTAPRARNARDLIGLTGVVPTALVAFFIVTCAVVGYSTASPGALWIEAVAVLLVSVAAIALAFTDGDPMPLGVTLAVPTSRRPSCSGR